MINFDALFRISYGLYLVCSGDRYKGNGFVSNTVFQVTAEPPQFAACCHKNNFTAGMIQASAAFSVSVLHMHSSSDIIGRFGYRSGRDGDKMEGLRITYGDTGVPIVMDESIAFLECGVVQTIDLGTHLMFVGELLNSGIIDDTKEPITYAQYRSVRKAASPRNAPTYIDPGKLKVTPLSPAPEQSARDVIPTSAPASDAISSSSDNSLKEKFKCPACGYIFDEEEEHMKFHDLPDDWACPLCGVSKADFEKM